MIHKYLVVTGDTEEAFFETSNNDPGKALQSFAKKLDEDGDRVENIECYVYELKKAYKTKTAPIVFVEQPMKKFK